MFNERLENITEEHLRGLIHNEIEESIRLEYKQQIDLSSKDQKLEAAKDVSALANTAGGRIVYGIKEKKLPDGREVPADILPLTDPGIVKRLEDILLATIHPRPRLRLFPVQVQGGFVLVVEVSPAYARDLHMVTGYGENRFYRRGEKQVIRMEEPEIREAYARIAMTMQALDARMERMVDEERALVEALEQSILFLPWFGHDDLLNPVRLGRDFGQEISGAVRPFEIWAETVRKLAVFAKGYRWPLARNQISQSRLYASVLRNGVVHVATKRVMFDTKDPQHPSAVDARECVATLCVGMSIASFVLQKAGYAGPVRIAHRLYVKRPFFVAVSPADAETQDFDQRMPADPDKYDYCFPETTATEMASDPKLIAHDYLDWLYQVNHNPECWWFDSAGVLKPEFHGRLIEAVRELLK